MRKLREVLRLRFELKLGYQQIGRSCAIGVSTVHKYLKRAEAAGITWPLPEDWDEARVETLVFPRREPNIAEHNPARTPPDFTAIHEQLRGSKYVTLQLLWEEYRQAAPDGYGYSRWCELYRGWEGRLSPTMRQSHPAGERMFVDYAGQTVELYDGRSGEIRAAQIFVAVMGASSYTYAEASWTQTLPDWIGSHVRALAFMGGAPAQLVPDNPKVGVTRANWYEPGLNRTYLDLATHYRTAILPARPRKPRDKAKVEVGVLVVERWILARLRNRRFFSLSELNQAIGNQDSSTTVDVDRFGSTEIKPTKNPSFGIGGGGDREQGQGRSSQAVDPHTGQARPLVDPSLADAADLGCLRGPTAAHATRAAPSAPSGTRTTGLSARSSLHRCPARSRTTDRNRLPDTAARRAVRAASTHRSIAARATRRVLPRCLQTIGQAGAGGDVSPRRATGGHEAVGVDAELGGVGPEIAHRALGVFHTLVWGNTLA